MAKPDSSGGMRKRSRTKGCKSHKHDVIVRQRRRHALKIEKVVVAGRDHALAAEGGRVEDDRPVLWQAVAGSDGGGSIEGHRAEEHVGAGDADVRDEPIERLAEGLGVEGGDAHG